MQTFSLLVGSPGQTSKSWCGVSWTRTYWWGLWWGLTLVLRVGGGAALALEAGVAGRPGARPLGCSGFAAGGGVGAGVRAARDGAARVGGTLGAFLRWDGSGGERGLVVDLSEDRVAWGGRERERGSSVQNQRQRASPGGAADTDPSAKQCKNQIMNLISPKL